MPDKFQVLVLTESIDWVGLGDFGQCLVSEEFGISSHIFLFIAEGMRSNPEIRKFLKQHIA